NFVERYSDSIDTNSEKSEFDQYLPAEFFKKRIELINGNLMIDCPVPSNLLESFPNISSNEFINMRYTACTSKPDNFKNDNFNLRQIEYEPSRETELFILITLNEEDDAQLSRTFNGIIENIAYLCSLKDSEIWKIVVCIISNGRNNINERALAYLGALGVYQHNIAKSQMDNKVVRAHIYEYTTQISIQCSKKSIIKKTINDGIFPTQLLFCLKEKEKDNADSFQWFFNAFCPILNPKICVLIKAGVKLAFLNPQVAGACGKLVAMKDGCWYQLLNPIIGAQIFDYEISNILDKPSEAILGYIQSLPEEFSAYRYLSLQDITNNNNGTPILSTSYLKYNYLLCFDLISKHNRSWILHYESSSKAEFNIYTNLSEFIHQQR
ncbi:7956_t:CDS:2, partial [Racocetra fulgida]